MLKEIILFELKYRRSRPATYIYFLLMMFIGFLLVTTPIVESFGSGGEVNQNGTFSLIRVNSIGSILGIFIISAIMGVAIIRDFEHNTEAIFFTTTIKKSSYLTGRFIGSFLVLIVVLFGFPLGLMLGDVMPWREAHRMGDFNLGAYLIPFFLLMVSNAFIMGTIFFAVGALSRKMIVVFMQGLVFFLTYTVATSLVNDEANKKTVGFLEPFGLASSEIQTEYWSISQKNFQQLSLSGDFLYNRLLWLGIAIGMMILTYSLFRFSTNPRQLLRKKTASAAATVEKHADRPMPISKQHFGSHWANVRVFFNIYLSEIVKSLPFITLTLSGILFFFFTFFNDSGTYGSTTLPSTSRVLDGLGIFTGFFTSIMVIMFTADLVWKEREIKMDLIQDAAPIATWNMMLGKLLSLLAAMAMLMLVAMVIGILSQLLAGYTDFNLKVYFKKLYGYGLLDLLIFMLFAFFIQVVVNNKFLGMGISVLLMLSGLIVSLLKVSTNLAIFNSGSLGTFSDMNGFGHIFSPFATIKLYWLALGLFLFVLASIWAVRGTEEKLKTRLQIGKYSIDRKMISFFGITGLLFAGTGSFYYHNTQQVNELKSEKQEIAEQVNYEKSLKKYENLVQPKIVDVKVNVDIFPETRNMKATGSYWLKNKSDKAIPELHLQVREDRQFINDGMKLNRPNKLDDQYVKDFGYYIYKLATPLVSGDSLKLDFKMQFKTEGFQQGLGNISIVENGTFFDNNYFPSLGYNEGFELSDDNERIENKLPKKERVLKRDDPKGKFTNYAGDDADTYSFEATVSTSEGQTAIAPGYLQKKWTKDGRNYFQYKMDAPIKNMYSIVSAEYAVKKEQYKGISLEIYYFAKHTTNIDRMMTAMKNSLDYYQAAFGPYQFRQLRIMEFPRYRGFAQSFANTIPFAEDMGFVADVDDKEGVDWPTFVTAHEIAHQWWGHQLIPADVQGAAVLSETFAEYSALMMMKKQANQEQVDKFVRYELDYYLGGRSGEQKKELPLALAENQNYIHYYKGALILYAIQDIIGEDKLNGVLKSVLQKGVLKSDRLQPTYPTTRLFVDELNAVLPDSLKYMVNDWVNQITFYDLRATKATAKKSGKMYETTLDIQSVKNVADSLGKEIKQPMKEWIWVGVYGEKKKDGTDNLIYYQRHKFSRDKEQIKIITAEKPIRAGIDPKHFLVDKNTDDNVTTVTVKE